MVRLKFALAVVLAFGLVWLESLHEPGILPSGPLTYVVAVVSAVAAAAVSGVSWRSWGVVGLAFAAAALSSFFHWGWMGTYVLTAAIGLTAGTLAALALGKERRPALHL